MKPIFKLKSKVNIMLKPLQNKSADFLAFINEKP